MIHFDTLFSMVKQKDKTTDNSRIQDVQDDQNEPDDQDETNDNSLDVFRNKIDFLVQDFIEREYPDIPESELKSCKGFFDRLVLYIYNSYLKWFIMILVN